MTITVGARLPDANLLKIGETGPQQVPTGDLFKGRKVVLFGLPGAYTGTCSTSHVPSFVRTRAKFTEKGVDEVICVSVNDPFVMKAWGEATGATAAGITMLGDPASEFTLAIGMAFSAVPAGLFHRSQRYALLLKTGSSGSCTLRKAPAAATYLVEMRCWLPYEPEGRRRKPRQSAFCIAGQVTTEGSITVLLGRRLASRTGMRRCTRIILCIQNLAAGHRKGSG